MLGAFLAKYRTILMHKEGIKESAIETSYHVDRISTSVILVLEIDIRFEYQHNIKYHMFIVQVPHQFGAKESFFLGKREEIASNFARNDQQILTKNA